MGSVCGFCVWGGGVWCIVVSCDALRCGALRSGCDRWRRVCVNEFVCSFVCVALWCGVFGDVVF